MKVTPVSTIETTPAAKAALIADSDVSGVGVPLTTTAPARFSVMGEDPPKGTPVRGSAVQEELPEVALGALCRQTTRNTCQSARKPWSPGTLPKVWSWRHEVVLVPGTNPMWVQSPDCGLTG